MSIMQVNSEYVMCTPLPAGIDLSTAYKVVWNEATSKNASLPKQPSKMWLETPGVSVQDAYADTTKHLHIAEDCWTLGLRTGSVVVFAPWQAGAVKIAECLFVAFYLWLWVTSNNLMWIKILENCTLYFWVLAARTVGAGCSAPYFGVSVTIYDLMLTCILASFNQGLSWIVQDNKGLHHGTQASWKWRVSETCREKSHGRIHHEWQQGVVQTHRQICSHDASMWASIYMCCNSRSRKQGSSRNLLQPCIHVVMSCVRFIVESFDSMRKFPIII